MGFQDLQRWSHGQAEYWLTSSKSHLQCISSTRSSQARATASPGRIDTLELAFDTQSLRTICESEPHAKRELGSHMAETLKHRLADLHAAPSPKDLVAGRPRELDGTGPQRAMAVDLRDGHRIVFCANHTKTPMTALGDPDWSRVSRVKILRIEKDNG